MRHTLLTTLCAAAGLVLCGAAANGEEFKHFDLGVGSYGSWPGLDGARLDWMYICLGNEGCDKASAERINKQLEMNPKLKIMVRLWPMFEVNGRNTYRSFMDYLHDETWRKKYEDAIRFQIHMYLDNLKKPENLYGFSLYEEGPHYFSDVWIDRLDGADQSPILKRYPQAYKAATGKDLPEKWDLASRRFWCSQYVKALNQINAFIKKESNGRKVFVYFMSHYNPMDWKPADGKEDGWRQFTFYWEDILTPKGSADGFFGYTNGVFWANRYAQLAQKGHWQYFSQLSQAAGMRNASWKDAEECAFRDVPGNAGFFFYSEDFKLGQWNDDPSVDPNHCGIRTRCRQFMARHDVHMDIVRKYLVPEVKFDHGMNQIPVSGSGDLNCLITNPRDTDWFRSAEEATLRNVKLKLEVPPEFEVPLATSIPSELVLEKIDPGKTVLVTWWLRRVRESAPNASYPVKLTVEAEGVERVVVTSDKPEERISMPMQFQFAQKEGKYPWYDFNCGWAARPIELTVQNIGPNPSTFPVITVGDQRCVYKDSIDPGEKLILGPGKVARLVRPGQKDPLDVTDELSGKGFTVGRMGTTFAYTDSELPCGRDRIRVSWKVVPPEKK